MGEGVAWESQELDFLGNLKRDVADLSGFLSFAREILQNAEDSGTDWLSFDFRGDRLIVENGSVFTERDWDRIHKLGAGEKAHQPDTWGAFQIGLVSMYYVSDAPTILSGDRQYTFFPLNQGSQRLRRQTITPTYPGVKILLPWARDSDSDVRRVLELPVVSDTDPKRWLIDLEAQAPELLLFCRNIRKLGVMREGKPVVTFSLRISASGSFRHVQVVSEPSDRGNGAAGGWLVTEREFPLPPGAAALGVKERRLEIAFPDDGRRVEGRLYALVPTRQGVNLSMHFNARFYPSSDRKGVIVEDNSPKAVWNRQIFSSAIDLYLQSLEPLKDLLDPTDLISLFPPYSASGSLGTGLPVLDDLPKRFDEFAVSRSFVPTQIGWRTAQQARLVYGNVPAEAFQALEALKLAYVIPEALTENQQRFAHWRTPVIEPRDVMTALQEAGIRPGVLFPDNGKLLGASLSTFYRLLEQFGEKSRKQAAEIPLAVANDRTLQPFSSIMLVPRDAGPVFGPLLAPRVVPLPDVAKKEANLLGNLCKPFDIDETLNLLETSAQEGSLMRLSEGQVVSILDYLSKYRSQICVDGMRLQRFRRIPLLPTAKGMQSFENVALPGGYSDTLELGIIVSAPLTGGARDLLTQAGLAPLDFHDYLVNHVVPALSKGPARGDISRKLIDLLRDLSEHMHEFQRDMEAVRVANLIPVEGGTAPLSQIYQGRNPDLDRLLPQGYLVPDRELLEYENIKWFHPVLLRFSVPKEPRLSDLVSAVQYCTQHSPYEQAVEKLGELFRYLGEHFQPQNSSALAVLRDLNWIPAEGHPGEFYAPSARRVYHTSRKYLFESQALFHPWPGGKEVREWFEFLGMPTEPDVDLVVRHLRVQSEGGHAPHPEIYSKISQTLTESVIESLRAFPSLFVQPQNRYFYPREVFLHENYYGFRRAEAKGMIASYPSLLEAIGAKTKGDAADDVDVLLEIARDYGNSEEVADDDRIALHGIYRRLSQLIRLGERLPRIDDARSATGILLRSGRLARPTSILILDKAGVEDYFDGSFRERLIGLIPEFLPFMETVGVGYASREIHYDPDSTATEGEEGWAELNLVLKLRGAVVNRIVKTLQRQLQGDWDVEALEKLSFAMATKIHGKLAVELDGQRFLSNEHDMVSILKKGSSQDVLVVSHAYSSDEALVEASREVARRLRPDLDPVLLLPGLLVGLDPEKEETQVERALDRLGYDKLAPAPTMSVEGPEVGPEPPTPEVLDHVTEPPAEPRPRQPRPGRIRFRLVTHAIPPKKDGEPSHDREKVDRREFTEKAAMARAMRYEQERGRRVDDEPSKKKVGFDLRSWDPSDPSDEIDIEVKGLSGSWDDEDVAITKNEFRRAWEREDRFYLYVVDYAGQVNERLHRIRNPARRATDFGYDDGWKDVPAEDAPEQTSS